MNRRHERKSEGPLLSSELRNGLQLLIQAYDCANAVGHDVWDFAVEIPVLQDVGFSLSEVRWLVCKGYALHARETTASGDECRSFQHQSNLALRKRSCVVLTDSGASFVGQIVDQFGMGNGESSCLDDAAGRIDGVHRPANNNGRLDHVTAGTADVLTPCWDCDRQELRLGNQVVKEFKLHSPNQVIILVVFEEQHWPPRVDDPLPGSPDIEPKQRLHDTIKSLNRNQKKRLIRFRGDGTGQGIRWELSPMVSQRLHLPHRRTGAM